MRFFQESLLTRTNIYGPFFLMPVLALLQPALFVLSQMDLGPLASAPYLGGFISADFNQTLLSLNLKCLYGFSEFSTCQLLRLPISQTGCIGCSSCCCVPSRTMRRSKPKAEVEPSWQLELSDFMYPFFHYVWCCWSWISVSLHHSLLNCVFLLKLRRTPADSRCLVITTLIIC